MSKSVMSKYKYYFCNECMHAAPCVKGIFCEINGLYMSEDDKICNDFEPLEL